MQTEASHEERAGDFADSGANTVAEGCADVCRERHEVAAYLDDELNADAALFFESHLAACGMCRARLLEQRRVLAMLDEAFGGEKLELPAEYAQVITARARNDMAGVRSRTERRRAFRVCVALSALTGVVLAAAGSPASAAFVTGLTSGLRIASSLFGACAQIARDLLTGAAVVMRAFADGVPAGELLTPPFLCALFVGALLLLARLVGSYRRDVDAAGSCCD